MLSQPDLSDNLNSLSILELGTGTGMCMCACVSICCYIDHIFYLWK
ncbi:MAG: polypeptide subunit release factor methylase [Bacillariaceae sp.]|jgi:methylase of polypeptide subunit release factors